ncbi:MAG TPA: HNH endonuclease [Flavipsychrobacter sp.]|nr:HNH endonuclease [Flavipsychrobacter sp.]
MDLASFLIKLERLNVSRSTGKPAPHKAVLLLSVIQGFESKQITTNKIFITPELVATFKDKFYSWVRDTRFQPNFSLPFYHLKSEGFWHLQLLSGKEMPLTSSGSIRSFTALRETIAYTYLSEDVYLLLQDPAVRDQTKHILIKTYLGGQYLQTSDSSTLRDIEQQILHEPAVAYRLEAAAADEEEQFLRNSVFKKIIPRTYNYTCCISGMQIIASGVQMIDACHIIPFALSHDDTISNGLSLCPNLHRAFDRFLITIDETYKVIVSPHFKEAGPYPIHVFHGQPILLPGEQEYFPAIENLRWHNEKYYLLNK